MGSTGRGRGGIALVLSLLLLQGAMLGGCGTESPLAPGSAPPPAQQQYTRQNPPPFLRSSSMPILLPLPVSDVVEWLEVVTAWVDAGVDKAVTGGRYKLHFLPGSLSGGAQIVVRERDTRQIEFELGPHGSVFAEPVELTIDFSGTNADPSSRHYDGSVPALYWFNEQTQLWESVPGKAEGTTFHTTLEHFSEYGLARGKSGW